MKVIKRFISAFVGVLLLVGLISGCSTTSSTAEVESSSSEPVAVSSSEDIESVSVEETVTETSASEQKEQVTSETTETVLPEPETPISIDLPICEDRVTLTNFFMTKVFDIVAPGEGSVWVAAEERTNVHIEFVTASMQAYNEQYQLMVASGEWTDIVTGAGAYYVGGYQAAIDEEFICNLRDIIEDYMPVYNALRASNEAICLDTMLDSGDIAGIYQIYTEGRQMDSGLVIRQDWLDSLGIATPETYADFYDVLTAFKTEKNADAALWIPYTTVAPGDVLSAGYGFFNNYSDGSTVFYQENGEVQYGLFNENYYAYLEMLNQWYSEGLIWQEFYTYKDSTLYPPDDLVLNDQTGIYSTRQTVVSTYDGKHTDPEFNVVPISNPVMKAGDTPKSSSSLSRIGSVCTSITTTCEHVDVAAKWLDYWFTDEGMMLANYGVEGEAYYLDDNGDVIFTELISNNPDGYTVTQAMGVYAWLTTIGTTDWSRLYSTYSEAAVLAGEVWSQVDNSNLLPEGLSLTVDESSRVSTLYGDIATYLDEHIIAMVVGNEPLSYFDQVLTAIEEMGINECVEIYQTALDRYKNRQAD